VTTKTFRNSGKVIIGDFMKIFILLLSLTLASCSSFDFGRTNLIIEQEKARHLRQTMSQAPAPKEYPIARELESAETYQSFVKAICENKNDEKCHLKYGEMTVARFKEAYPLASEGAVTTHCQARPVECKDLRHVEDYFRDLHLKEVRIKDYRAEKEAERERTAAAERERQRNTETWRAISNSLQEQQRANEERENKNKPINTFCQPNGRGVWCQSR
jgi:hypothetical protein